MAGLSVVIPTKNEEENLRRLLEALRAQTVEPDEVIVVDAHSTDDTTYVAREYGCRVYVLDSTIGYARHFGTLKARGDIVFQTDADALPVRTWIEAMTAVLYGKNADLVTGCVIRWGGLTERLIQAAFAVKGWAAGANMCYLKKSYMKTEGFPDTNSMEDVRLVQSFREKGLRHVHVTSQKAAVYMKYNPLKWLTGWLKAYAPGW